MSANDCTFLAASRGSATNAHSSHYERSPPVELLGRGAGWGERSPAWALARFGIQADRELLRDSAVMLMRAASAGTSTDQNNALQFWLVFQSALGEGSPEVVQARELADYRQARFPGPEHELPCPTADRSIQSDASRPARGTRYGVRVAPPKSGGQPDWRNEPQWLIGRDGRPLTIYGQLPVPGRLNVLRTSSLAATRNGNHSAGRTL